MKLYELSQRVARGSDDPEDGEFTLVLHHDANAQACGKALAHAGWKMPEDFEIEHRGGGASFIFPSAVTMKAAKKIVWPSIDTSKEPDWED